LLDTLDENIEVHQVSDEIEELHVKYLIEKNRSSDNRYLIYTQQQKDDLKFIREYCETNGTVEIKYLQNYIKEKLHKTLNLNLNMTENELISAAQVSVGRDANYWISLSSGVGEIFDMEKLHFGFKFRNLGLSLESSESSSESCRFFEKPTTQCSLTVAFYRESSLPLKFGMKTLILYLNIKFNSNNLCD